MPRVRTGVDIGTRSAKLLRGFTKGNTFVLTDFAVQERLHPGPAGVQAGGGAATAGGVRAGWEALEPSFKPLGARIGLTGRDVNIRYTRVPRVPDWQLKKLMRFEVEEVGGQSGTEVASDFNVLPALPELEDEDVVLLALARESLLEEHMQGLAAVGGKLDAFTPNAVALYNAWLRYGVLQDDTVLVANIGHDNLDVVLARGADLLFARNLSGGARLFDEAIAQRCGCSLEKAAQLKHELATLEPGARMAGPEQEKASRACLAPAGQILSLLQSAVLFCKSQVKISALKLDRVMLCGGGAALKGLDKYLENGLAVKVERFDPFRVVDTSKLAPEALEQLESYALEAVVALGLATAASDPAAYAVEILPAKVRARREFAGGTLFLIAAGVLAVSFLGLYGWRCKSELSRVRGEVAQLQQKLKSARAADGQTRALLAENQSLRAYAEELYTMAGSGAQLARTLDALARAMPADFWLTRLTSAWRYDPQLGVQKGDQRPLLHIEGAAREGTDSVNVVFERMVDMLNQSLPGVALKTSLSPTGQTFALDLTLLAPAAPGAAGTTAAAGASGSGGATQGGGRQPSVPAAGAKPGLAGSARKES